MANQQESSNNYVIDINKIYSEFIKEIDSHRSMVNINNPENMNLINKLLKSGLKSDDLPKIRQNLFVNKDAPQESRHHAFLRIIGFPVVSANVGTNNPNYYNPGFDIISETNKTITDDIKITILNQLNEYFELSTKREKDVLNTLEVFSKKGSLEASVLSLYSSTNIRPFNSSLSKYIDPFYTKQDQQTINYVYNDEKKCIVGQKEIRLVDLMDAEGHKADFSKFDRSVIARQHILAPFIVDPRIDLTVTPANKKVGIPFVRDITQLKISENDYVKRPYIEKVIRDRLAIINPKNINSVNEMANKAKEIPSIKGDNLLEQVLQMKNYNDQEQFFKYLNIIISMLQELCHAQKVIKIAQQDYYWLPTPSTIGPEGGNGIQEVFLSKPLDDAGYVTDKDQEIRDYNILKNISNMDNLISDNSKPQIGSFIFGGGGGQEAVSSPGTIFNIESGEGLGNNYKDQYNSLNEKRTEVLKGASEALKTIEIIMGEFSGLGLCDIIAIIGSLYVMPITALYGLLDKDAYNRMVSVLGVKESPMDINNAMNEFLRKIKGFYEIMDKMYLDLKNKNKY